jgi:hypothetical protein
MPNTYTELRRTTLSTSASTITLDNIPQNYTDLVLVFQCSAASANMNWDLRVGNGTVDSGSNYSATYLVGGSGGATSNRVSNQDRLRLGFSAFIQSSGGVFTAITQFMNYSNTTTNKTVISRDGNANQSVVESAVGLWRSTAAINIITMGDFGGSTMAAGTTVSLYGIANADLGAAKATGGIITEDATYWYHTFGASGAFIPKQSLTCDILVVAGGGGGGSSAAGGGGAGGLLYYSSQSLTAISYNVTVGAGGTSAINTRGGNGGNSTFGSLTSATGGGGGAGNQTSQNPGSNGGSGGGGAVFASDTAAGSASPSGQGNNGGVGTTSPSGCGGGGGGAGAVGGTSGGGDGVSTYSSFGLVTSTGENISGTVWYAGGGGGSRQNSSANAAPAGKGGGTAGAITGTNASNSPANTGGGAGAGWDQGSALGGKGGSGVVIVRYAK